MLYQWLCCLVFSYLLPRSLPISERNFLVDLWSSITWEKAETARFPPQFWCNVKVSDEEVTIMSYQKSGITNFQLKNDISSKQPPTSLESFLFLKVVLPSTKKPTTCKTPAQVNLKDAKGLKKSQDWRLLIDSHRKKRASHHHLEDFGLLGLVGLGPRGGWSSQKTSWWNFVAG